MRQIRRSFPSLLILVLILGIQTAHAQKNALQIDYMVTLSNPETPQFHITTDIKNINQSRLAPAAAAGLKEGDLILKIDGVAAQQALSGILAGTRIKLSVNRGGGESELPMTVGSRNVIGYTLSEVANPTGRQKKIREGWLKY